MTMLNKIGSRKVWKDFKRVPRMLQQTLTFELKTVDEDCDQLLRVFEFHMNQTIGLETYIRSFEKSTLKLLSTCKEVGVLVLDLYNPTLKLKQFAEVQDASLEVWKGIRLYSECIKSIERAIQPEIEFLLNQVLKATAGVLDNSAKVENNIRKRERALYEYDRVRNKVKSLQATEQSLSVQQAQSLYSYERQIDVKETEYNRINEIMKLELPIFFDLVKQLLQPLNIMIYFVQLNIYYNFVDGIAQMKDIYPHIQHPWRSIDKYVKDFNNAIQPIVDKAESLDIVKYRQCYFESSSATMLYEAIFTFMAQREGDLSINKGDIIKVIETEGDWYIGELNGEVGVFPNNYVRPKQPPTK